MTQSQIQSLYQDLHLPFDPQRSLGSLTLIKDQGPRPLAKNTNRILSFLARHQDTFAPKEIDQAVQAFYSCQGQCDVQEINPQTDPLPSDLRIYLEEAKPKAKIYYIGPLSHDNPPLPEGCYLFLFDSPKVIPYEGKLREFTESQTPFILVGQQRLLALHTLLTLTPDMKDTFNQPDEILETPSLTCLMQRNNESASRAFITLRNYVLTDQACRAFSKTYTTLMDYAKTKQKRRGMPNSTVWETKRAIPKRHLDKMMANDFLTHGFSYVEIDESVNLFHFETLEKEYKNDLYPILPKLKEQLVLRFRKLGRHNSSGLYNNDQRTIVLDPRDTKSLVHEYGHALDYETNPMRSKQSNFQPILDLYYESTLISNSYYLKPKEIFARAFEFYIANKYKMTTHLHQSYEDLLKEMEYYPFVQDQVHDQQVTRYFDKLFERKDDAPNG